MWLEPSEVFWTRGVHVCVLEDPGVFHSCFPHGEASVWKGEVSAAEAARDPGRGAWCPQAGVGAGTSLMGDG